MKMGVRFTITAMQRKNNGKMISLDEGIKILSTYYRGRQDVNVRRLECGCILLSFRDGLRGRIHPRFNFESSTETFSKGSWEFIKLFPR